MIISHQYRFIYFEIAKTGSTSMRNSLQPFSDVDSHTFMFKEFLKERHIPPTVAKSFYSDEVWNNYFKFVVVRNPWDWVISQWRYNLDIRARLNRRQAIRASVWNRLKGRKKYYDELQRNEKKKITAADIDMLYQYMSDYGALPERKNYFQSDYVFDNNGNRLVDFVGIFENLEEDFDFICKKLGLNASLPRLNSSGPRVDYRNLYTEDGQRRVAELWAVDIKNFNYVFNQPDPRGDEKAGLSS